MDRRSKLVVLASLVLASFGVQAGYAQLSPPAGWSAGGGAGGSAAGAAANDALMSTRTAATLNAGGRVVKVPAAMRLAANAGRFAARGMMLNPLAIGAIGAAWLASQCISYQGGAWVITCGTPDGSPYPYPQTDGKEWNSGSSYAPGWFKGPLLSACMAISALKIANKQPGFTGYTSAGTVANGRCYVASGAFDVLSSRDDTACPAGWYVTPAGCVQTPPPTPISPAQIETKMDPIAVPPGLPLEIPGVPLPIEIPVINPTPGTNPTPQPLRIPQGDPVKVPNSNPEQWKQPWLNVQPSPTAQEPWRVDVKPEETVQSTPTPNGTETVTSGSPSGAPKDAGLCEQYPDILACQKVELKDLQPLTISNKNQEMAINKDDGWGPSSASCPPPRTANFLGRTWSFPWTMFCDFASMIRPLLIGFAWLSAALTFLGMGRKD